MPIGLKGNSDGSGAIQIGGSDAISITTGLNTTFAGTVTATGTVAGSTGTLYPLTSGTAVASTSGTAIDFTGIPSWAKRVTVMFNGVSLNGSSDLLIQVGAGSITSSGYLGGGGYGVNSATSVASNYTTGFGVKIGAAAGVIYGTMQLVNISGNIWVSSSSGGYSNAAAFFGGGGNVTLGGTLDRVRITTVNGTDTFDAGSINILFE